MAFASILFLPGSLVSCVLSNMVIVDQDNGLQVAPTAWLYWAISVPPTIVVFILGWLWYERGFGKGQDHRDLTRKDLEALQREFDV